LKSRGQLPQERQLYADLLDQLGQGQVVARATLVRAWGSTPREVGAKMLVFSDGSILGTVGGGCGEAEVWQAATEALQEGLPRRVEVDLTEDQSSDSGKVCGGRFEVFVDVWKGLPSWCLPGSEAAAVLITSLGPEPQRGWRKQSQSPGRQGSEEPLADPGWAPGETRLLQAPACEMEHALWSAAFADGLPKTVVWSGHEFFLEPLGKGLELVVAGAGHIARPLCAMASLCGYSVVVVDDRDEYARPENFPSGRVQCQPFEEFFANYAVHPGSHVVLVTRGHKHDEVCLRQLVKKARPAYLGMIGSRRRCRAVLQELGEEGVDSAWLAGIYAPIGLDIGAQTPEEIAVAILAEIILARRGGRGGSLRGGENRLGGSPLEVESAAGL